MSLGLFIALLLGADAAAADGIIIPEPPFPHLAIKYHKVKVEIADQAAHTAINQVFLNRQPFELEGTYLFPLPVGASFSAFSMYMDGKPLAAEILKAEEARRIYEEIVRRRLDPALLEYAGQGAYQARIFPIPAQGEKRVELAYDEVLRQDGGIAPERGIARYLYPLNTEKFSSEPLEVVSVEVEIQSSRPIKAIYSPSHQIAVERDGEYRAKVIYADEGVVPREDFALYYTTAPEEVGLDLLTYFPQDEAEGYYLLLAAPQVEPAPEEIIPKRLVLVLDRSGSMAGEKIEQARAALNFAIQHLEEGDEFGIVDYGTTVTAFADTSLNRDTTVAATPQAREAAMAYVEGLEATGGTNILEALVQGLGMMRGDGRAEMCVFLTDGKPTVGETDTPKILQAVREANRQGARIFVFGVGYEVNTHLLDQLAGQHRGSSTYVEPGEDLEVAVSSFYAKVSGPVLAGLELGFAGGRSHDAYPPVLPDLFSGGQVVQLGRLQAEGEVTVKLSGQVGKRQVVFERQVDSRRPGPVFLPRLWATRKVGFLLDQIRLHGEDPELVDEVVALSKRYGIITPYTSFLILEDEPPGPIVGDPTFRAESGADAVAASERVQSYAGATTPSQVAAPQVRYVGDKTFYLREGYWRDSQYDEAAPVQDYLYGSENYFQLVAKEPQLGPYLALGKRVMVQYRETQYRISESGDVETGVGEAPSSTLPRTLRLDPNFPNPFNGSTVLRYHLPQAGEVRLEVFDLQGQRIKTLVRRVQPAGVYEVSWEGRNERGEEVGSGVYLGRLQTGQGMQVRKVVLVR